MELSARNLKIGYDGNVIVPSLNLDIKKGAITAIIGPNGCGKSTILKTMARLHPAMYGSVILDGKDIKNTPTKEIARKMAILPQSPEAPAGLSVTDLVSYGRTPYQGGFSRLNEHDREMVDWSIRVTGLSDFKDHAVDSLSGGQRQRAWIAMAIAQETGLLLLDEPTTYLDMAHQLEVLELLKKLNQEDGRTIVMVIHDLNHASRFADELVAIKKGQLILQGSSNEVMSAEVLKEVFQIDASIVEDPRTGKPAIISYDLVK
ncbi:ABC transporter ATP-binding protein [Pradoshia sp. D12]|uniref:ABC transporter ATP-binding protein n=1 Tax=Bacillaceae TaxID=186817 RepID=UPI00080AFCFA|nr:MULTISPECIES: ABC transporter ATP-binding protein [Bacillaceae]OCA81149.1 iron-dicitrate transporter ATP-binding subunit [Bacillus sp. FJAT-27986]QFK73081.1 ABC transporter ATP-binding protein [Pradoshia sp. D12]TPF72073.1 ABC transporter ATP-binding protein [Bacillus sp. D12]